MKQKLEKKQAKPKFLSQMKIGVWQQQSLDSLIR
jgi:hypothetical protein